jgi:hypothetical protein
MVCTLDRNGTWDNSALLFYHSVPLSALNCGNDDGGQKVIGDHAMRPARRREGVWQPVPWGGDSMMSKRTIMYCHLP